jgi:hypothetical protein
MGFPPQFPARTAIGSAWGRLLFVTQLQLGPEGTNFCLNASGVFCRVLKMCLPLTKVGGSTLLLLNLPMRLQNGVSIQYLTLKVKVTWTGFLQIFSLSFYVPELSVLCVQKNIWEKFTCLPTT